MEQSIPKQLLRWAVIFACLGFAFFTLSPARGDSPGRVKIRKTSKVLKAPTLHSDDAEEYNAEKAALLAQKRRSLIEDIKKFIRDARDNEQAAELNLRLGALYMEDYYAGMAKAHQDFDRASTAHEKNRKKGKAPNLDTSEAKTSLTKARSVYKDLLRRAPNHRRRDEVLYFLAVSSLDDGKTSEATAYLQRIVRELPKSKHYPESLLQLADYYFEKNNFRESKPYYEKIIARKHVPLLPYATYKKAWCEFNLQSYNESLKDFKWVIAFADSDADRSALQIRNEAIRDIALAFGELKATSEAVSYFQSLGMPHHRTGMENLASIYFDKGQHAASIAFYEALLELDNGYAKNAEYDLRIVEALHNQNREDQAAARLFDKLAIYVAPSNWYELNASTPSVVQGAYSAYEEQTRKYAFRYHAQAQKTKSESLYERAKTTYAKYIEYFARSEYASKIRFYLAEIQYKQHQYVSAADNYFRVYQDVGAGNLREDGIRYALNSLDQQLNDDRKKSGLSAINNKSTSKLSAKEEESLEPIPYTPSEAKFLEIADEYLKHYPTAKDAGDVLYEQDYLRYAHHELPEAYRGFWTLIQKYPGHATSGSSAQLILDILNRRKEYPKLIAACHKFLETKELNRAGFRESVSDILRKSELKRIALIEEKGEFKEAADGYIEYTKVYGTQEEALFEKALYNAAIDYSKAGQVLAAAETQERFLRRFPKSRYRENMVLQVAKTYETLAIFDKAGKYFEEFANTYPSHAQAKNALRLAGIYLSGGGQNDRAEDVFQRFMRLYPAEARTVEKDLLTLYENQGATDKQIRYYLQARAGRGITYSDYLTYTLAAAELSASKSGKAPMTLMEEARKAADRFAADIRKSPKGVEALAKIRFWWVSNREALFLRYRLALPQETMAANLKRKLLLLQELEREYGKIASLGNAEWGLGSIYKTASIYRHMAEAVQSAPVPAELDAEQLDSYRGELKRQMIEPFNEKAKSFAANCLDKAQEFNVLSEWTAGCYRILSELDPERYPRVRTFYLPSLALSLQLPARESKTPMGSVKRFGYPLYSSALFAPTRKIASLAPVDLPLVYDASGAHDAGGHSPVATNYENLATDRKNLLRSHFESEKPSDSRRGGTFAYLNILRIVAPNRAVPAIEMAIQKDPENAALVNLLGLAHYENGKLSAAQAAWMSLVARGQASAAVWNNLGVAAIGQGWEAQGISYFQEAIKSQPNKEAYVNLGNIALKYRNGFDARNYFKKAVDLDDDDLSAQAGLAVGYLQNREMDNAKDILIDLSKRHAKDPFIKLSLGYFLVDVEKEPQIAEKIVRDYMDAQSMEKDLTFRQLLLESHKKRSADQDSIESDVPGIE
jgi:cellulose synthase operon protein C